MITGILVLNRYVCGGSFDERSMNGFFFQAMILRDQKGWSGRSATEKLFWTSDLSIDLVSRSTDWIPRDR